MESPTDADVPAINMILQSTYSLDFKNRYVNDNINMESSKIIANISQKLRRYYQIWNSQLPYFVNTSSFVYKYYNPDFSALW